MCSERYESNGIVIYPAWLQISERIVIQAKIWGVLSMIIDILREIEEVLYRHPLGFQIVKGGSSRPDHGDSLTNG